MCDPSVQSIGGIRQRAKDAVVDRRRWRAGIVSDWLCDASRRPAIIATVMTALFVGGWLSMDSPVAHQIFPTLSKSMPDKFWVSTFANLLLIVIAYGTSIFLVRRRAGKELTGLTIWGGTGESEEAEEK